MDIVLLFLLHGHLYTVTIQELEMHRNGFHFIIKEKNSPVECFTIKSYIKIYLFTISTYES